MTRENNKVNEAVLSNKRLTEGEKMHKGAQLRFVEAAESKTIIFIWKLPRGQGRQGNLMHDLTLLIQEEGADWRTRQDKCVLPLSAKGSMWFLPAAWTATLHPVCGSWKLTER